jgi:hypothetical protein
MDERLSKALSVSNALRTYNNQKELIKEEYKESLHFHKDGYRFTVTREIINFLVSLETLDNVSDIVILDDFENPFMIEDVKIFKQTLLDIYFKASNQYYYDFTKLKNNRSIEGLLDL